MWDLSPFKTEFSPKKFQSLNVVVVVVVFFFFFFFFLFFLKFFLKIRMQRGVMKMIFGDEKKKGLNVQIVCKTPMNV